MGRKKQYSEKESKELEEALESNNNKVEIKRILAVKARAELGFSNDVIGRLLNYSEYTVRDIIGRYNRQGLAGLKLQQFRGGRRRENMSISEEKELLKDFSDTADTGRIVTVGKIKSAYENRVGRKVHISTVTRLLRRHGWRKILPRPYHPKKDIEAQDTFKKTLDQLSINTRKRWVKTP